jgi:hypothetical protein
VSTVLWVMMGVFVFEASGLRKVRCIFEVSSLIDFDSLLVDDSKMS